MDDQVIQSDQVCQRRFSAMAVVGGQALIGVNSELAIGRELVFLVTAVETIEP